MSKRRDWEWHHNGDFRLGFSWKSGDVNNEISEVLWTIATDEPTVFSVASGHVTIIDDSDPRAILFVPKEDILMIPPGIVQYDVTLVRASDAYDLPIMYGGILVLAGVGASA